MTRKFRFLPLLLLGLLLVPVLPSVSHAQVAVGISVRIGPPPLPVYAQPICPGPRYIWVPGYWAYGPDGYYWVPGTWVLAPRPGFLWTPGWWGFADGVYVWHRGYWGPHVGFYGGINYGFGYTGVGFVGGYWRGNEFFYNRAVTNVNVTVVRNVYVDRTVVRNVTVNRISFNGRGGIEARPTPEEMRYEHEQHMYATREQDQHREEAARNRNQWASVNHGRPAFAATRRPGDFNRRDSMPARNARFNENRGDRNTNGSNRGAKNRDNRGPRRQKPKHPRPQKVDRHPHGRGRGRG